MRSQDGGRRIGLRAVLTVPVIVLVVSVVLALFIAEEWAAREQTRSLLDRRAETVISGISARLDERRRNKILMATLLAREPDLPILIERRDVVGLARLLVPLRATLDLDFVRVVDAQGQALLTVGEGEGGVLMSLVPKALAGLTESSVAVEGHGLQIAAAMPVKGRGGIIGVLTVASCLQSEELQSLRESDDLDLVVLKGPDVVASTLRDASLQQIIVQLGGQGVASARLNESIAAPGYIAAIREAMNGSMVVLIATHDILDATRQRTLTMMLGLLGIVSAVGLIGMIYARQLTRALGNMTRVAASISEGRYDERIPESHIREFNIVGRSINRLASQVDEQLKELTRRAFYDRLTDLPNRALLKDRLRLAMMRSKRRQGHVAVMFLDLDNFKIVNDSLGHDVGDALLVALADRLRLSVRPEDTVARLGGDEFVVLVEEVADADEARVIADRLLEQLTQPYQLDGHTLFAAGSIGIALSSLEATTADDLMRNADVAMYHAKSAGKGRCAVFAPEMNEYAMQRLALETDLRGAHERGEMRVVYQPIVRLETGQVIEVEALLRWDHPTRGEISPTQFISIAEEAGLIVPLGAWVLREAARCGKAWQDACPDSPIVLGVNLSARQFQQPSLVDDIARIIAETGLDPHLLKLEITESVMMHDVDAAVQVLNQLKALGIQLAIDDFGTGYSSLAQLRRLPVDILKIDREFVSRLEKDPEDEAIVRSIISLAGSLNLQVTGEGIETAAQAGHLRELGCAQGQGYFYARPMRAEEFRRILAARTPVLPPSAGAANGAATPTKRSRPARKAS
ncbi:MAG: EAL domain-containing protein [Chloroflexi bacterium]|nr:EAL domain-containing protein [Chloroflexota bacterium]